MKYKYKGETQVFPILGLIKQNQELDTENPQKLEVIQNNDRYFKPITENKKTKEEPKEKKIK